MWQHIFCGGASYFQVNLSSFHFFLPTLASKSEYTFLPKSVKVPFSFVVVYFLRFTNFVLLTFPSVPLVSLSFCQNFRKNHLIHALCKLLKHELVECRLQERLKYFLNFASSTYLVQSCVTSFKLFLFELPLSQILLHLFLLQFRIIFQTTITGYILHYLLWSILSTSVNTRWYILQYAVRNVHVFFRALYMTQLALLLSCIPPSILLPRYLLPFVVSDL